MEKLLKFCKNCPLHLLKHCLYAILSMKSYYCSIINPQRYKKLHKIIYSSPNKIDWDAQSAFKITNYYTDLEDHMIFCYLKQYLNNGCLKLCSFCFDSLAVGKNDLQLCFNLNPSKQHGFIHLEFGIDGISSAVFFNPSTNSQYPIELSDIEYSSFKTNDQQGYYWCGEITLSASFIEKYFHTSLSEKSIILLNFYKIFPGSSDHACLFADPNNILCEKHKYMEEFVILNY